MDMLEKAVIKTKNFIAKMKGMNTEINGRPLIDFADFTILNAETDSKNHVLKFSIITNPFDQNERAFFEATINKKTGDITNFKRIDFNDLNIEKTKTNDLLILIEKILINIVKEKDLLIKIKKKLLEKHELQAYSKIDNALVFLGVCINNINGIKRENYDP